MSQGWTGKRKTSRMMTRMPGRAICFDEGPEYDVTVIDVSATGARIEFAASVELPEEFTLSMPLRKEEHIARVRWQREATVGVEFMPTRSAHSLESVLVRLDAIERRLAGIESAPDDGAGGVEASPILGRIAEIEARVAELHLPAAEPAAGAGDDRLTQVEARLVELEAAKGSASDDGAREALLLHRLADLEAHLAAAGSAAGEQTAISDRLTRLEWRLDEIGNDIEALEARQMREALRFLDERLARLEAMAGTPAAPPPSPAESSIDAELAGRVADLEGRMRDGLLRLRALERQPASEQYPLPQPVAGETLALEVAELRAGIEALVMALSLGLGRAAA